MREDKNYFKRAIPLTVLYKVAFFIRRERIFKIFMDAIKPLPDETIVDIGVFAGSEEPEHNFLEQLYKYPENITAVGVNDASFLERQYPGLSFMKVMPGQRLPFNDNQFDVGFCSAVIEHTGSFQDQKFFLEENIRVCRRFFLSTPNRFYPLEFHTLLPFLHWLPAPVFRKILKKLGLEFYSKEENLNLLTKSRLLSLVPAQYKNKVKLLSYRLLGMVSNLILIVKK